MVYLFSALVAILLGTGQALWKGAATAIPANSAFSFNKLLFGVFLTPRFIAGGIIYVLATVFYVWLFTKYPYFQVQFTLMSASVIFTLVISVFIFKDNLTAFNFIGALIILVGAYLINFTK